MHASGADNRHLAAIDVFVEGKLISQSPWEIVAYLPLKGKLK
jgi:hypothetical protein